MENFREVKNYANYYNVSDLGQIKSLRTGNIMKKTISYLHEVVYLVGDDGVKHKTNVDKLVMEAFNDDYNGEYIWHKDGTYDCKLSNLTFTKKKQEETEYEIFYKTKDQTFRSWNSKTEQIRTLERYDNETCHFEMFDGYEKEEIKDGKKRKYVDDDCLLQFVSDFKMWSKDLMSKDNDILKILYTKYKSNYMAVSYTFKRLADKDLLERFAEIKYAEHELHNKTPNAGIQFLKEPCTIQSYGYDFSMNYPSLLASEKLQIPVGEPVKSILDELPKRKQVKLGIYRVKITCNNNDFRKVFQFSKDNHYCDISLKFAMKHKKKFNVNIELINDGETNAYIYDEFVTGDEFFGNWFNYLEKLKKQFKGNRLIKHLSTSLWGTLTHPRVINRTYEQIIEQGIKIDEDYEIHEHIYKKNGDEYYVLTPMKNIYYYNIRIKPWLTALARVNIAEVIMDGDNIDHVIRVQTDGVVFDKSIYYHKFERLGPEDKTTGMIKWTSVNNYEKVIVEL